METFKLQKNEKNAPNFEWRREKIYIVQLLHTAIPQSIYLIQKIIIEAHPDTNIKFNKHKK